MCTQNRVEYSCKYDKFWGGNVMYLMLYKVDTVMFNPMMSLEA